MQCLHVEEGLHGLNHESLEDGVLQKRCVVLPMEVFRALKSVGPEEVGC